jgi:hypothetical protein
MKHFLAIVFVLLCIAGCNDGKVYICNGPKSKAYHKTKHCQGLKRCSTDIEITDMETAKMKLHRKSCNYCY